MVCVRHWKLEIVFQHWLDLSHYLFPINAITDPVFFAQGLNLLARLLLWRDLLSVNELKLAEIVCGHLAGQADYFIDKLRIFALLNEPIVHRLDFPAFPNIFAARVLAQFQLFQLFLSKLFLLKTLFSLRLHVFLSLRAQLIDQQELLPELLVLLTLVFHLALELAGDGIAELHLRARRLRRLLLVLERGLALFAI